MLPAPGASDACMTMDDIRPPEAGGGPDETALLPQSPPPQPLKRRRLFDALRRRKLENVGSRLQVLGPAVQVAPQPASPPPPRRRSITWRVLFGLIKTLLLVGGLGAVAARRL